MDIIKRAAELIEFRTKKTIADHYKDGENFLLNVGAQTPLLELGQLSIQVDMADYLRVSDDGKDGYVTVYPVLSGSLAVGISPYHLGVAEYKFANGQEDLTSGIDVKGFAESSIVIAGYGVQLDERGEPLALFDTDPINLTAATVSVTAVRHVPISVVERVFALTDPDKADDVASKILAFGQSIVSGDLVQNFNDPQNFLENTSWSVSGAGENRTTWDGSKLYFTKQAPDDDGSGYDLQGYFDWKGSSGSYGRETFIGDLEGNELELVGQSIMQPAQGLVTATYTATLSNDGHEIVNGQWSDGIPGHWSADILV